MVITAALPVTASIGGGSLASAGAGLGLGEALSVGGSLLGGFGRLFGSKKKKQQQPIIVKTPTAFGQQSPENIAELQKQFEDYFINAEYGDFFGRPTRRLTLGDIQGDFTPKALFEKQNYFDEQATAQPQMQQSAQPAQSSVNPNMLNEVYGRQFAQGLQGQTENRSLSRFTPEDFAALGELASKNKLSVAGAGTLGGSILSNNRVIDNNDLNAQIVNLLMKYAR